MIEIALGIVLAVLILAFLPQLLGLGVVLALLALLAICGIFAYSWITEHPTVLHVLLAGALGCILFAPLYACYTRISTVRELQKQVHTRRSMGYDATEREERLEIAVRALSAGERLILSKSQRKFDIPKERNDA